MYVTLNRLGSAEQVGDASSTALQNNALADYLTLSSTSLATYGKDLSALATTLQGEGLDIAVTPQDAATFITDLQQNGVSALPQQEQDLFNEVGLSATDQNAIVAAYETVDPSSVSSSIVALLLQDAKAVEALAATYGQVDNAPCFAAGTLILTDHGEVKVEALAAGERLITLSGETRVIRWIGHRRVSLTGHPRPESVSPVRICAHAFGPGLPRRDLILSPDHAIFQQGVLIPVHTLIDGFSVVQELRTAVTYHHVELECHDVILAEGLPAETYLETGNRKQFANAPLVDGSAASNSASGPGAPCAPMIFEGPIIELVRALLHQNNRRAA